MCLITVSTAAKTVNAMLGNQPMIESIFDSNSDGLGAMYRNKKGLRIVKILPRDLKDCLEFFRSMPQDDRMLAVHWRMKTHGHVDLTNCHPYDVVEGKVAMMHNGILHTGNAADPTMSDTWHFIKDLLAEPVAKFPGLVHEKTFLEMCGEYIGSNRFVFMDDEGRLSIVNRDQGIEHDGMWFANTYAWEPSTFIPSYKKKWTYSHAGYESFRGHLYESDEGWDSYYTARSASNATALTHYRSSASSASDVFSATKFIDDVHSANVDCVSKVLEDAPYRAIGALMTTHRASVSRHIQKRGGIEKELTGKAFVAAELALAADTTKLQDLAARSPKAVAETICYYLYWDELQPEVEDEARDSGVPSLRYLDCGVYIRQCGTIDGPTFAYSIYDPDGNFFMEDEGFASPEEARQCAIDDITFFEDRIQQAAQDELDADAEFADRAMDLAALHAAERDTVNEE